MTATPCVECEAPVPLNDDLMCGEILMCPDCGVELEVASIDPLAVRLAPEVQEDWGE
jgi:alpha-aminoadipate carrier protein LysW